MRDTLRLKGDKHSNGETVEFTIAEVSFINQRCGDWWIEQDGCVHVIDPATIQPADDQRKQMLDDIKTKIKTLRWWPHFEDFKDLALVSLADVEDILREKEVDVIMDTLSDEMEVKL